MNFEGAQETARSIAPNGGPGAFAVAMDITNSTSVNQAFADVYAKTGAIDILVNNVGIAGPAAPLWDQKEADWHRAIAVNMDGIFHCCRAVIGKMRERKYGRIVSIASIAGKEGNPNMIAYSSTKAAVIGFTEMARQGSGHRGHLRQLCGARRGPHQNPRPADAGT